MKEIPKKIPEEELARLTVMKGKDKFFHSKDQPVQEKDLLTTEELNNWFEIEGKTDQTNLGS